MLAGIAGKILKLAAKLQQFTNLVLGTYPLDEFRGNHVGIFAGFLSFTESIGKMDSQNIRNQFRHPIDKPVRMPKHPSGIANHRLGCHGAEGDDLTDMIAAVLLRDIVDDFIASIHTEIDIEIWHGNPIWI